MTPHRIKRVTLALTSPDAAGARAWSDRCSGLFPARIAPLLDRLCSEADDSPHPRRIDRLELDLGRLDPDDEETLVQRLADALRPALARALADRPHDPSAAPLALLTLFARTGNLPWAADRSSDPVAAALTALASAAPHALQTLLRDLADDAPALARLARHAPPPVLAALLARAFPEHAALLAPVRRALEPGHETASADDATEHTPIALELRRAVLTTLTRGDVGPQTFTPLLALTAHFAARPDSQHLAPARRDPADPDHAADPRDSSHSASSRPPGPAAPPPASLDSSHFVPAAHRPVIHGPATLERFAGPPDSPRSIPPRAPGPASPHDPHSLHSPAAIDATDSNAPPSDPTSPRPLAAAPGTPHAPRALAGLEAADPARTDSRAPHARAVARARSPRTTRSTPAEVFANLWRRARDTRGGRRHAAHTPAAATRHDSPDPPAPAPGASQARGSAPDAPRATDAVPPARAAAPPRVTPPTSAAPPRIAPGQRPADHAQSRTRRVRQQLLAAEGELQLEDGGLVLLWPFLTRMFERLALIDEQRRFLDDAARQHAVALIAHLATGDPDPPEYQRTLAKLLCAHDLAEPCMRDAPIPDEHRAEAEHLLHAVLDHVPALHALDVASLRAAFLVRPAVLGTRDGTWTLQVERQPHDVVLDTFPWSWTWIKLPWMPDPLRVEW